MPSILSTLRNQGKYWLGRALSLGTSAANLLRMEKTRPKVGGPGHLANLPWFLPYVTNTSDPKALRYTYRSMTQEPSVKAGIQQKAFAVASLDLQVIPASDDAKDQEIARFVKWNLQKIVGGFAMWAVRTLLSALTDGWDVSEKLYAYLDQGPWAGRWIIKEFAQRDNHHLEPEYDPVDGKYLGIREVSQNVVHNPAWLVIFTYLPLYGNVMGQSDLWAAYRDFYLLDTALKLRTIALDRWTLPMLMGTYADPADKTDLEDAMRKARAMSWFSIPEGTKIEALKIAQSGTSDFEAAINSLKQSILQAITLSYLQSTEGTVTGARSMGEVHADIAELPVWFLAVALAQVINEQIIPDLVDLNYVVRAYPSCALGGINVDSLVKEMQIYQGASGLGLPLSKNNLYKRLNLEKPMTDADRLDAPEPQGQAWGQPFRDPQPGQIIPAAEVAGERPFGQARDDELQQTDYTCGPAALRRALSDLGFPDHPEATLAQELKSDPKLGTSADSILQWSKTHGLTATMREGWTIQELSEATGRGERVLCAVQAWGEPHEDSRLESGHWIVVQAVDGKAVTFFDPSSGQSSWTHREMSERWIDQDQQGRIVRHLGLALGKAAQANKVSETENILLPEKPKAALPALEMAEDDDADKIMAGPDGKQMHKLMQQAKKEGMGRLTGMLERKIRKVLKAKQPESAALGLALTTEEQEEWADFTATLQATGELFGRATVRERAKQAGVARYADRPTNFVAFSEAVFLPDSPEQAVSYFKRLIPQLNVNPERYAPQFRREAFTMAHASTMKLLKHVQKIILDELEHGGGGAGPSVQAVLKRAGVHPSNPQYAEMVVRTNLNDSYTEGITDELRDPEMQEVFPVWKYIGIEDGRQGKDHEPKFGRYYSSSSSFAEVRGDRPYNCRCTPIPVSAEEWLGLLERGERLSTV